MSCKLEIRVALPDDHHYEPQDVTYGEGPDTYRNYKLGQRRRGDPQSPDAFPTETELDSNSQTVYDDASPPCHDARKQREPRIDLVCRRLTVKWEPIFNIVHRYLICRCVLRLSTPSRSRFNPEHVVLVPAVCPRHDAGGKSYRDYGDLVNNHEDPYFSCFGGYDSFRAVLASNPQLYEVLGGETFLTSDERRRGQDELDRMCQNSPEELDAAWNKYNNEFSSHLRGLPHGLPKDAKIIEDDRTIEDNTVIENDGTLEDDRVIQSDCVTNSQQRMAESPMGKELDRILAGEWDGRPHWVW